MRELHQDRFVVGRKVAADFVGEMNQAQIPAVAGDQGSGQPAMQSRFGGVGPRPVVVGGQRVVVAVGAVGGGLTLGEPEATDRTQLSVGGL